MAASFEIANLSAWYGNRLAIEDMSLSVEPNQVTALIGPSGCGKSTLVRCLNRLHELIPGARAEGKVVLDGENIYDAGVDPVSVRRAVGMVFQRPNPFPTMSILDNTIAGFKLNGRKPKAELLEIVQRALTGAGLWDEVKDRLNAPATGLSGGQQQRLCIARAIAVQPEILLMDEPCSALDPVATLRIEDLIMELRERYTIVLVTHNMQQAARVADRTAFLLAELAGDPGRIIEIGPTKKIFTQPEDKRTEGYITGRFG
ncbi:MAG TPA: phosphate ABC transporter ATP-binding protein PstB [Actinomycetota bacterium]|jgi:phosphate transport system ATP-binding protein|nr:phosphate ABC transporter ATP-binding protein PstB [Actinomycetota bacterium]